MIPKSYISEASKSIPWQDTKQIEQDLIISRALIELYAHPNLREAVAFRGGTALNKLIFNPPSRYSEDIDLVQITGGPIGNIIRPLREVMDSWLGKPKRMLGEGGFAVHYKIKNEDGIMMKLKFEINTREHGSVLGFQDYSFTSNSSWHPGTVTIRSYKKEELLATKLRALYQRRKGRDLYDLYTAFMFISDLDADEILQCFKQYLNNQSISKDDFLENMNEKLKNKEFREDIFPLLSRNHKHEYNPDIAYGHIRKQLIERL